MQMVAFTFVKSLALLSAILFAGPNTRSLPNCGMRLILIKDFLNVTIFAAIVALPMMDLSLGTVVEAILDPIIVVALTPPLLTEESAITTSGLPLPTG